MTDCRIVRSFLEQLIVFDTGILGMLVHPSEAGEPRECRSWLKQLVLRGASVHIPEIADYELRRELLRMKSDETVKRLDALKARLTYVPITTAAMLKAAEYWATTRGAGRRTAGREGTGRRCDSGRQERGARPTGRRTGRGDKAPSPRTPSPDLKRLVPARRIDCPGSDNLPRRPRRVVRSRASARKNIPQSHRSDQPATSALPLLILAACPIDDATRDTG